MHIIKCSTPNSNEIQEDSLNWGDLNLPSPWCDVVNLLVPESTPRPVQIRAIRDARILSSRRNLLVSAPTNSGKTLVGYLILFDAIKRGKRAVLLEPLRAIAQEKADEMRILAKKLGAALFPGEKEKEMTVTLSTGDYRLQDENFSSPPPSHGELIVATPERLEAILRNPQNDKWAETIGAVFVDEAHTLSSPRRGGTLEYLITLLLVQKIPPRLVLVSATMGGLERLQEWLSPCDQVSVSARYPALQREIWVLDANEQPLEVVCAYADRVVKESQKNLLVFVYQTRSAESLANEIKTRLPESGCRPFHSRMSFEQKKSTREDFCTGNCRVLVSTTALALGVNLPATDLLIRDVTFPGVGRLGASDLIQMSGRAGRGDQEGRAVVVVRPGDQWHPIELKAVFEQEKMPPLASSFDLMKQNGVFEKNDEGQRIEIIAEHVASLLSRYAASGLEEDGIHTFFSRSLAGDIVIPYIREALRWLCNNRRVLAYKDENERYRLTVLGRNASRSAIPLKVAAGVGSLFRDILRMDPEGKVLQSWRPMDQMILLHLLYDGFPGFKRYSMNLLKKIMEWMEDEKEHQSTLYTKWLRGTEKQSGASQVLGSLGIQAPEGKGRCSNSWAFKFAQHAIARSCLIFDMCNGRELNHLERYWSFEGLVGVEEKWRDSLLWLLAGLSNLMDVRCFYYHLKEHCNAPPERIRSVGYGLKTIRWATLALQNQVKYCSPFGALLQGIRRFYKHSQKPVVGFSTFKSLAERGIVTPKDLATMTVKDFLQYGVRRNFAEQIDTYMRRRLS